MTSKIQIIPNNRKGQLNTTFLATLPGVLKLAEITLCFVAFILAICSDRRSTSSAWTDHISFECMIVVSALLLGYVAFPHLTLKDEATREGLIVVELLFYGINTLFFFIAVFLMIHVSASWTADGRGAAVMCAVRAVSNLLTQTIISDHNRRPNPNLCRRNIPQIQSLERRKRANHPDHQHWQQQPNHYPRPRVSYRRGIAPYSLSAFLNG